MHTFFFKINISIFLILNSCTFISMIWMVGIKLLIISKARGICISWSTTRTQRIRNFVLTRLFGFYSLFLRTVTRIHRYCHRSTLISMSKCYLCNFRVSKTCRLWSLLLTHKILYPDWNYKVDRCRWWC